MATTEHAIQVFRDNDVLLAASDWINSINDIPLLPVDLAVAWPKDLGFLDNVGILAADVEERDTHTEASVKLLFATELTLGIPGLEGGGLVIGSTGATGTTVSLSYVAAEDQARIRVAGNAALRFSRDMLKPVEADGEGGWREIRDRFAELRADLSLTFNGDGSIDLGDPPPKLNLGRAMIGDSGFVVEVKDAIPILGGRLPTSGLPSDRPQEIVDGWQGIYIEKAALHLPEDLQLPVGETAFENCYIGSGGFTGEFNVEPDANRKPGTLFGMTFTLDEMGIAFRQNALTKAALKGKVRLPFFDEDVKVDVGFDLDGNLTARLGADNGACKLSTSALELTLKSLGFTTTEGQPSVVISGSLKPTAGGLDWPSFDVKELVIDAQGNVHLDGGWQDLSKQYTLNFHGFQVEVTKLGFGTAEDGRSWIGFSGRVKLAEGFPAGASVEGLRILWDEQGNTDVTFNGVGVEFEVPEVLRFKGAVAYNRTSPDPKVTRFDGAIKLELLALDMEIDAKLVFGSHTSGYGFFAIYVGVELPAGIPLWATGLGLYGMAGLFALNMEPNKKEKEPWYGMGKGDGWYKRDPVGVTELAKKWGNRQEALALGAGVTIGTLPDGGYNFSGKMLLVIVFPGPILLVEGKANLLKERAKLDEEPNFRALAVLDARAGTFLFGLDAQYKYTKKKGDLIDIRGSAEAFFSLSDPERWHLYIGKQDPKEQRIRARIVNLFEANAYFMLDAQQLKTGAWIGYAKAWEYSVVALALEAWIDTYAVLSWKPVHFHGGLWLHGKVALRALFLKLALTADALLEGDVPDPFHLLASLRVAADLPWPLPDFEAELKLEWGPEPTPPPLPLPLEEVAVEHLKVTTSWPLTRGKLLLPNCDGGDGFLVDKDRMPGTVPAEEVPTSLPVVPLDCRPHITFSRPVNDYAQVAAPRLAEPSWEYIGDPTKNEGPVRVRYHLKEVILEKWVGGSTPWKPVAQAPQKDGVPKLYGSWAPLPAADDGDGPVAQTKLWLWSKTPFDYTRHGGTAWEEWFTRRFDDYPCLGSPQDREIRCDFESLAPGTVVHMPHAFKVAPQVELRPGSSRTGSVDSLTQPLRSREHALRIGGYGGEHHVAIDFAERAKSVKLAARGKMMTDQVSFLSRDPSAPNENPIGVPITRSQSVVFEYFDPSGQIPPYLTIDAVPPVGPGVDCGQGLGDERLEITFFVPVSSVELTLTVKSAALDITAVEESGAIIHPMATLGSSIPDLRVLRLVGNGITQVVIRAPQGETWLHRARFAYRVPIWAVGASSSGTQTSRISTDGDVLALNAQRLGLQDLKEVHLHGEGPFHLAQIRAIFPPNPQDVQRRQDVARHLADELARWEQEDNVLEPETTYRLSIVTEIDKAVDDGPAYAGLLDHYPSGPITEHAYFKTAGPPGVSPTPSQQNASQDGLDDLTPYVRQTVPATVPPPGEKPSLPRPVYRAYDVGVEFNENYVELMYRLAQRDLALYLYDQNNRPARDAQGRLILLANRWGRTERLILSRTDERTVATYNASRCAWTNPSRILRNRTLTSVAPGQVLEPDAVHEARLIPLLFHEDFEGLIGQTASGSSDTLGEWQVLDLRTTMPASKWQVVGHEALVGDQVEQIGTTFELDSTLEQVDEREDQITLTDAEGQTIGTYVIVAVDESAHTVSIDATPALGAAYPAWRIKRHRLPPLEGKVAKPIGASLRLGNSSSTFDLNGVQGKIDILLLHRTGSDLHSLPILSVDAPERVVTVQGRLPVDGGKWSWEIPAYSAALQTVRSETLLLDDRGEGTDVRLSALLRTEADDRSVGLAFRYQSTASRSGTYYLLLFDPRNQQLRLEYRSGSTVLKVIQSSHFAYEPGRDYLVTVEAIGTQLRAYVDGQEILTVEHEAQAKGVIGLYSGSSAAARFSDVRVDDLSSEAPVAYAFKFTTSRYANFYHHVHSHQDETWTATLDAPAAVLKALVTRASQPVQTLSRDEEEAYQTLIKKLYNPTPHQPPSHLEVTRVNWKSDGSAFAYLIRSPEPIDWTRTRLQLRRAPASKALSTPPGTVKLTGASFGSAPHAESVTLLLRQRTDLSGYRIDTLASAGEQGTEPIWKPYYTFGQERPLPAGTRMRIYTDGPLGAPDPEPGMEQRFVAEAGESGNPLFDASGGVQLRILDPDGVTDHARHFWPEKKHTMNLSQKLRVLRKKDGTAFFVLVPTTHPQGAHLDVGDYRLTLTYHLRNTDVDPQSQVLSQAGSTLAEQVAIDIPWTAHKVE